MEAHELRLLITWAEAASTNAGFWQRLWIAASAYDVRTKINIRALVVNHGTALGAEEE